MSANKAKRKAPRKDRTEERWCNLYPPNDTITSTMHYTEDEARRYASSDDAKQCRVTIHLPAIHAKRGKGRT